MALASVTAFIAEIDRTLGIYLDMRRGFGSLLRELNVVRADFLKRTPGVTEADLNAKPFTYEITDAEAGSYILHACTQEEYRDRISPPGENARRAGNMCLVHIYELWEVRFREEIARALGINRNALVSDVFGDMRLIRNSILHHDSVALPEVGRCRVVNWFQPDSPIAFSRAQVLELGTILRRELLAMETQRR
jgi:hypothetical protein